MKLVIQIPCLNEAETLPQVLRDLPREVQGFDVVEWLVVDDGSTDGTAEVARRGGVTHVVVHPCRRGLARAFMSGLHAALAAGADIIVNLDGDNQYCAADIPLITRPVCEGRADMAIGARPIDEIRHFSAGKKLLQFAGSWAIRMVSGTQVADAPSGFRAISRRAAMQVHVFSNYSYTLETIIQAGQMGLAVMSVPVRVNQPTRPSRLLRSTAHYLWQSLSTVVRIFVLYRPFRFFMIFGMIPFSVGALIGIRFLGFFLTGHGSGRMQSLILAAVLLLGGMSLFVVALLADLIAANRQLLESIDTRLRHKDGG